MEAVFCLLAQSGWYNPGRSSFVVIDTETAGPNLLVKSFTEMANARFGRHLHAVSDVD